MSTRTNLVPEDQDIVIFTEVLINVFERSVSCLGLSVISGSLQVEVCEMPTKKRYTIGTKEPFKTVQMM